jgi:hypothetical protein
MDTSKPSPAAIASLHIQPIRGDVARSVRSLINAETLLV